MNGMNGSTNNMCTPRLLLSRIQEGDLSDFVRMYRDPRVTATLGGVRSEEQTRELLGRDLSHWEQHGFGRWVMRELGSGCFVGRGGLRRWTVDGRDEVELGYGLLFEYWGRGLATELALASVAFGFQSLQLTELICFALPTNAASRRVMEKAGFRYEREIVHADLPHVLYRLSAAQWRLSSAPTTNWHAEEEL